MQNKDKDIDSKKLKGLTCSVFSFNSGPIIAWSCSQLTNSCLDNLIDVTLVYEDVKWLMLLWMLKIMLLKVLAIA